MTTEYTPNFRLALPDFRMGPWHDLVNNDFVMIDELLLSLFQGVDTAVWQNNTAYAPGTSAIDPADNTVWVCCVSHTSAVSGTFAADRAAHPTYWNRVLVGISPRGVWANSTHYLPNDLVTDPVSKVIALCINDHISSAIPATIRTDAAHWTFLADLNAPFQTAVQTPFDGSISHIPPSNVQTAIDYLVARGAAMTEAPIDGQVYGRQNVAWTAVIPILPAIAFPSMDSIAAVGVSVKYAREDHVHPSDTSKANISYVDAGDAAVLAYVNTHTIPDAPSDGNTYGRLNAAWATIGGSTPASVAPIMDGVAAVGTQLRYAREDHVHPSDTSRAPLASPALTGSPTTPNQAANDNSTKIANTAYVDSAVSTGQALDMKLAGNQTTTGGFNITPFSNGSITSGTFTPNALNHNYQYYLNNGAHTFGVPANDCALDVLIQNGVTPGAITFSTSYRVGANVGDAYATTTRFSVAATFTNASSTVGVVGHGAVVGDPIYFTTAGTLPTNFVASTLYRVVSVINANSITVSATVGGAAIVAGSAGSGVHTSFFPSQFIISVRRINGVSTYTIKALQ